ncbi:MAG: response regulator [Dehalococcoidia bacterium]|nr:response regulator [Dehalococcoidia bacterium]
MAKPVILSLDDDAEVLRAIARDLRQAYGDRFRIVRAGSGERALDALRQLKLANEPVALLLVDQRMPEMTGIEFLEQAVALFPDARRALLTAYADTDAAIQAINAVRVDYYLLKPWDPPESRLYPVLDDLLDDWMAGYRPAFEGVRLVGHRWSAESHRVRDFFARNQVPFRWHDLTTDAEAAGLLALADADDAPLPLVIFPDGTWLSAPANTDLAPRVGLRGTPEVPFYDLLIVGAGPAGLAAAVYGASEGLHTLLVERDAAGGQAGMSSRIENYLGFPGGLSGNDLARRALTQAQRFGAEFLLTREATHLQHREGSITVGLDDGSEVGAASVIIATGVSYRRLEAPGVEELTGRGIYYGAAMTEAESVRGERICIVGGANSAGQAALHFADYAREVTLLVRGPSLDASMSRYLVERVEGAPNVEVRCNVSVLEARGEGHLESLVICDPDGGRLETVHMDAMFVFIGATPPTNWLAGGLERDDHGYILTGQDLVAADRTNRTWPLDRAPFLLETSVPGVFSAGDVRHGSGKRVAAAVGEGAMAVMSVWQQRAAGGL